MRITDKFFVVVTMLACVSCLQVKAQDTVPYNLVKSTVLTISSVVLNESRTVYIHCPKEDTSGKGKRYPVLYLMDGESHFDMLAQYVDYLSRWDVNVIPEMIVVGIVNTKRTRDLTPTASIINYFGKPDTSTISWMKPSGGNEKFLQFIQTELVPYIDHNYNTAAYKIFAGHSFGGLAAINCMLTHPGMFDAYIAISPSFWWDNMYALRLADSVLEPISALNKKLFFSDANEGVSDSSSFHTNVQQFDALLRRKALKGFDFAYKYYPTETHMTEPMPAYYDALRFIYKDWKH